MTRCSGTSAVLTAGVVSQQLPNAPRDSVEQAWFTAALPGPVSTSARFYKPPAHLNP